MEDKFNILANGRRLQNLANGRWLQYFGKLKRTSISRLKEDDDANDEDNDNDDDNDDDNDEEDNEDDDNDGEHNINF